jgi:hypothetical protein
MVLYNMYIFLILEIYCLPLFTLYNAKSTSFEVYSKKIKNKNLETTRAFESINILLLTSVVLFGNCSQELAEILHCM